MPAQQGETMPGPENQLGIQLPRYVKVIDLGAETTISMLLN